MSADRPAAIPVPLVARAAEPGRMRRELGMIVALWRRDMMRFRRDTGRWIGLVMQLLLIWWLLGAGMRGSLSLPGGAAGSADSFVWYLPGAVAMIALFTSIFATMAVIEDRQHGFLQQVLVAPASKASMILGKTMGVLSVALIQLAITLPAFALAGLDLALIDWPLLLAVFIAGVVAITTLSFALAWVVRTTHAYHALMGVFLIPLWLVSGALFPLPDGGFLRWVNAVNPLAYMVDGMRHAFAGGLSELSAWAPWTGLAALTALKACPTQNLQPLPIVGEVPSFTLTNQAGEAYGSADLDNRAYLVSFFFTTCSTVCPAIMRSMKTIDKHLGDRQGSSRVRLVSISVDPEYDTPEVLAKYASREKLELPRWQLLTGPRDSIESLVVGGFRTAMGDKEERTPGVIDIAHSMKIVLVDARGKIRHYFSAERDEDLALAAAYALEYANEEAPR